MLIKAELFVSLMKLNYDERCSLTLTDKSTQKKRPKTMTNDFIIRIKRHFGLVINDTAKKNVIFALW